MKVDSTGKTPVTSRLPLPRFKLTVMVTALEPGPEIANGNFRVLPPRKGL
jgi:hypothetical protein